MQDKSVALLVEEFVEEGKLSLVNALEIAILLIDEDSPGVKIDDGYFVKAKSKARVSYERVVNALPEDSTERETLKHAHAYLTSILEDFQPYISEGIEKYEKRIRERIFQYRVLANRVGLGR